MRVVKNSKGNCIVQPKKQKSVFSPDVTRHFESTVLVSPILNIFEFMLEECHIFAVEHFFFYSQTDM